MVVAIVAACMCGLVIDASGEARVLRVEIGGLTPAGALGEIRMARVAGYGGAWEVHVAAGMHELCETLEIAPSDSGTPDAPVTWVGEDGATLCGGRVIDGWKVRPDGLWEAPAPVATDGTQTFLESMYSDGRRLGRAALFHGEFPMIDEWTERAVTNADGTVSWIETVRLDDSRLDALAGLPREELEAVRLGVIAKWAFGAYSVVGYDASTRTIEVRLRERLKPWTQWNDRNAEFGSVTISLENVRAGLSSPGCWFYDRPAAKLLYRPMPGEAVEEFRPYAPTSRLVSLVRFAGDADAGEYVHDVVFRNIDFACTRSDGELLPCGMVQQYQYQGARCAGGAVVGEGLHRVTFDGCSVRDTENYGLWLGRGCVSNRIVNCRFSNLGAGGIWIGDTQPGPEWLGGERLLGATRRHFPCATMEVRYMGRRATAYNIIDNCEVVGCGAVNPEGCGIVLTHVSDSSVTHCDIHDIYYTGVSVGWTWGFLGSVAQRNTIAFNRIWDIGKGVMSDMGGIYTLGASFGTCISNNVVHSIRSHAYGGWGLYNDEGSEGIVWENNLVFNTSCASYHANYGRGNIVRNNILADAHGPALSITCSPPHRSVTFERNVVYRQDDGDVPVFKPPVVYQNCTYADVGWSSNVFWSASGCVMLDMAAESPWMVGPDYSTRIEPTQQLHCAPPAGFVCDPKFADPARRDYTVASDSPAIRYGFRPWDVSISGVRKHGIKEGME